MKKLILFIVACFFLVLMLGFIKPEKFGYNYLESKNDFFGGVDFDGGWNRGGCTIIDGEIYCQKVNTYNMTSLNITHQNLTITDDIIALGNMSADFFIGDGSELDNIDHSLQDAYDDGNVMDYNGNPIVMNASNFGNEHRWEFLTSAGTQTRAFVPNLNWFFVYLSSALGDTGGAFTIARYNLSSGLPTETVFEVQGSHGDGFFAASGDWRPLADDTYNLGTSSRRWKDGYFSGTLTGKVGSSEITIDSDDGSLQATGNMTASGLEADTLVINGGVLNITEGGEINATGDIYSNGYQVLSYERTVSTRNVTMRAVI